MNAGLEAGLALIALAAVLLLVVWVVSSLRRAQRSSVIASQVNESFSPTSATSNLNDAILIIQAGGRVEYMNELARTWFGMRLDEQPDLERIFRRVRPAEEFIDLCTRQGQKRVSISGQLAEVTSYQVPGPDLLMLVAMRGIELSKNLTETKTDSSILQLVTDFGTKITGAGLNLEDTLHAIMLSVSQLVPADFLEVKIWDETRPSFRVYMLESSGVARVQETERSQFEGLTQAVVAQLKPLLIPDTQAAAPAGLNGQIGRAHV